MKPLILIAAIFCCPLFSLCQDISGLWKGSIHNDSTNKTLDYEVFIMKNNGKYSGVSHTWFQVGDKKYFGIKKVQVRKAKDGKIVIQDGDLIANDYPGDAPKKVRQLNVLDLSDLALDGQFMTIPTREYSEVTGQVNLKKVSELSQSDLMDYLNKNNMIVAK